MNMCRRKSMLPKTDSRMVAAWWGGTDAGCGVCVHGARVACPYWCMRALLKGAV